MSRVTAPQAAKILNASRTTVFKWVDQGHLPAERVTRRHVIMIDVEDLKRFAKQNGYSFDEQLAKRLAK